MQKETWLKETAQIPRIASESQISVEALARDNVEQHSKGFTWKEHHDGFHGPQTLSPSWDPSSIKITSKDTFFQLC